MKVVQNERGAALIVSLFIIVLIGILVTSLSTVAFSSLKQINLSENNIETTHLAEMGILYYENKILAIMKEHKKDPEELIKAVLEGITDKVQVDSDHSFEIELDIQNSTFHPSNIDLVIKSTGIEHSSNFRKSITWNLNYTNKLFRATDGGGGTSNDPTYKSFEDLKNEPKSTFPDLTFSDRIKTKDVNSCDYNAYITGDIEGVYFLDGAKFPSNCFHEINGSGKLRNGTFFENAEMLIHEHAVIEKDLKFNGFNSLTILKNMISPAPHRFSIENNTEVSIGGFANFERDFSISDHSKLTIDQQLYIEDGANISSGSQLIIKGKADFTGNFTLDAAPSSLTVNQDAFFHSQSVNLGGNVKIDGNAVLDKGAARSIDLMINPGVNVSIGKKFYIVDGSLTLGDRANLIINDSARFDLTTNSLAVAADAKIDINGNSYFTNSFNINNISGTICIAGDASFHSSQIKSEIYFNTSCPSSNIPGVYVDGSDISDDSGTGGSGSGTGGSQKFLWELSNETGKVQY
jgi:hypothetical protein